MDRPATSSPRFPRVSLSRYQAAKIMRPPDRTGEEEPNARGDAITHTNNSDGLTYSGQRRTAPLETIRSEQLR